MKVTNLLLLIALMPFILFAETKNKYEKIYNDCIHEEGQINNTVVAMCSENTSAFAKKEMNRLYKIIYRNISVRSIDDAKQFENSQIAWLKYRNIHCKLMGNYVGSPMYYFCPMEQNIKRVLELETMANEYTRE